jgi:hypothetical protein
MKMKKKMKKQILLAMLLMGLFTAMAVIASSTLEGCAGKLPPISTMVPTATP